MIRISFQTGITYFHQRELVVHIHNGHHDPFIPEDSELRPLNLSHPDSKSIIKRKDCWTVYNDYDGV